MNWSRVLSTNTNYNSAILSVFTALQNTWPNCDMYLLTNSLSLINASGQLWELRWERVHTTDYRFSSCYFLQLKSWIKLSVLETFYDILKVTLVLNHPVGWEHWLLGKIIDIPAQFDYHELVFWSILFLWNLRFDRFSVFQKIISCSRWGSMIKFGPTLASST